MNNAATSGMICMNAEVFDRKIFPQRDGERNRPAELTCVSNVDRALYVEGFRDNAGAAGAIRCISIVVLILQGTKANALIATCDLEIKPI